MEILIVFALIATAVWVTRKNVEDRLLAISSMGVKVSILIALMAWKMGKGYLMDISVLYLLMSGAGVVLMIVFLTRSDIE